MSIYIREFWNDPYLFYHEYPSLELKRNNIQVLNHLALVSHGSNNPEFTFLEKENKMLISQYFEDLSVNPPDYHKYILDLSLNLTARLGSFKKPRDFA